MNRHVPVMMSPVTVQGDEDTVKRPVGELVRVTPGVPGFPVHPEPVTVITVPMGAELGERAIEGAPDTRGLRVENVKTTKPNNARVRTSDSFLRLLVNSRILQYLCNTQ